MMGERDSLKHHQAVTAMLQHGLTLCWLLLTISSLLSYYMEMPSENRNRSLGCVQHDNTLRWNLNLKNSPYEIFDSMPRKAAVSKEDAIAVVKQYMQHFLTHTLPKYTDDVWIQMSRDFNGKWSPHSVYTNIREDRRQILSTARSELGIVVNESAPLQNYNLNNGDNSDEDSVSPNEESTSSQNEDENGYETFDLIFTKEEWNSMKPGETVIYGNCKRKILKPGVWTNVIALAFWKQFRMPCAFSFKRADVLSSPDDLQYNIKITGTCKDRDCSNLFKGEAVVDADNEGFVMTVRARDTRFSKHADVKRPLNGERRKEERKKMIAEGPSGWRKRQARENMKPGDTEPPQMPRGDVVRRAKKEAIDEELGVKPTDGRDLIRTIEELNMDPLYRDVISAVSSTPFSTFYGLPAQLHAYKEYCRATKGSSSIKIDSTGSLILKLQRPNGESAHIFFFAIVVNFEGTTVAVNQMISERNETEFIEYWLKQWLRSSAPKPKEAVCDYSRALLSALSFALNNRTIKQYINDCFAAATGTNEIREKPSTFIRIDVAHLTHLVCRWKCFDKVSHAAVKEFYIRCVALMVNCQTVAEFEKIFVLTSIVGLQTYDDAELDVFAVKSTYQARKTLEGYIANGSIIEQVDTINANIEKIDNKVRDNDVFEQKNIDGKTAKTIREWEKPLDSGSPIERWIRQRLAMAKKTILGNNSSNDNLNAFHLPDFIQNLSVLSKEFPLWTAATLPYDAPHASSSHVEGYFRDLKTRVLIHPKPPMRVDYFLKQHLRDILGATPIFNSKMLNCVMKASNIASTENPDIEKADIVTAAVESRENEKVSTDSLNPLSEGTKDVYNIRTGLTENVSSFGDHLWKDIGTTILDDSDLKAVEDWRNKARGRVNIGGDDWSDESSRMECNASLDDNRALFSHSIQSDHSYCQIEEKGVEESDCVTFGIKKGGNLEMNGIDDLMAPVFFKDNVDQTTTTGIMSAGDLDINGIDDLIPSAFFMDNLDGATGIMSAGDLEISGIDELMSPAFFMDRLDEPTATGIMTMRNPEINGINDLISPAFLIDNLDGATATNSGETTAKNAILKQNSDETKAKNAIPKQNSSEMTAKNATPKQKCTIVKIKETECSNSRTKDSNGTIVKNPILKEDLPVIKKSKYFKPYPEIRQINQLLSKNTKPFLLPNGNQIKRPLAIDGKQYFVINTCAFDSLVHVHMTSAIDDLRYASILEQSENSTLKFVSKLINKGVTTELLRNRAEILKSCFTAETQVRTECRILSYTINAWTSIGEIAKMLMASVPSMNITEQCTGCEGRSYSRLFISPNHKILIAQGFGVLERALDFYPVIKKIKCKCSGLITRFNELNYRLLIDLDIRETSDQGASKSGLRCLLRQFPKIIRLRQKDESYAIYSLSGVVVFEPGHFIAYCRRASGRWQLYDDRKKEMGSCNSNVLVEPHLAIYIRQLS